MQASLRAIERTLQPAPRAIALSVLSAIFGGAASAPLKPAGTGLALAVVLGGGGVLGGCTDIQVASAGDKVATAELTLARVRADYATARAVAAMVTPFLPADAQARVTAAEADADQALAAAQAATDAAEQLVALARAEAAIGAVSAASGS